MNRKAKALEFIDSDYGVKITGRHVEVTDSMKSYALDKLSKIERFINRIIEVEIVMDIQKIDHIVEIIIKAGSLRIKSHASSTDMYVSIDMAVDKLGRQLKKYKSKLQDHHAKGHIDFNLAVDVFQKPEEDEEIMDLIDGVSSEAVPEIVKQDVFPLKTLTYDEAIMKMELSHDAFMLFKNESDHKLKVIYRREDGDYGIIEPNVN